VTVRVGEAQHRVLGAHHGGSFSPNERVHQLYCTSAPTAVLVIFNKL
jgi:hypothetical protein